MGLNLSKVNNVSAETKSAISRKSAQTLPNNPSERGYSAEEIKRRFYQPVLDAANSAIAEIDRVVNEINSTFSEVGDELDNFIDSSKITEPYKVVLDDSSWTHNAELNMYELFITKDEHGIEDYKEIGVDMFLLDGNGNYTHVNQFEVSIDGTVRCFHETNGAGFISIYVKREGFVVGNYVLDADHVVGLAKVGRTNNYYDLDNTPNLDQMNANEVMISKIISGGQEVNKALTANSATSATYAQTSGASDTASNAKTADQATADQFGVNIANSYAKQVGNYPSLKVGRATSAEKAQSDEEGTNIKNNYAKQNGTYANMTVGKATSATNATNAVTASKAIQDSNGDNIASTYAKITGTYNGLTVGNAVNADTSKNATNGVVKNGSFTSAVIDENNKLKIDGIVTPRYITIFDNGDSSTIRELSLTGINEGDLLEITLCNFAGSVIGTYNVKATSDGSVFQVIMAGQSLGAIISAEIYITTSVISTVWAATMLNFSSGKVEVNPLDMATSELNYYPKIYSVRKIII